MNEDLSGIHVVIKTGEVLFMKKEKERKNWRENLVTSLEVPGDLAMKETIITLTGRNQASSLQLSKAFSGISRRKSLCWDFMER